MGLACLMIVSNTSWAAQIFSDNFDRAENSAVGMGWKEIEPQDADVKIINNRLRLQDYQSEFFGAAAFREISTAGFTDISLEFDWVGVGTEGAGKFHGDEMLHVDWDLSDDNWVEIYSSGMPPKNPNNIEDWTHVSLGNLLNAEDQSSFRLRFWTTVNAQTEAALIDNVKLLGSQTQTLSTAPEPGSFILMASGLAGLIAAGKKNKKG